MGDKQQLTSTRCKSDNDNSRAQANRSFSRAERGSCGGQAAHKMPITATQPWVVSLSLSLKLRRTAHHWGDNDDEDVNGDVDEDVGNVGFSQKLAEYFKIISKKLTDLGESPSKMFLKI